MPRLFALAACGLLAAGCSGAHHAPHGAASSTTAPAGFASTYLRLAGVANASVDPAMRDLRGPAATLPSVRADLATISAAKRAFDRALFASLDAGQIPSGQVEADVRSLLVADNQFETALERGAAASATTGLAAATTQILSTGDGARRAAATVRGDLGLPPPPDDQA